MHPEAKKKGLGDNLNIGGQFCFLRERTGLGETIKSSKGQD